jgi:cellulose biosynthesis protein BcsQ
LLREEVNDELIPVRGAPDVTKTIAVYSMKGGVGKTTLAVNLAYCSAVHSSRRTLLWDIDAQGSASFLFVRDHSASRAMRVFSREIEPSALVEPTKWPGLDLLAADLSLRHLDQTLSDAEKPKRLRKLLKALASAYDRIILDCPPGLGEVSDQLFRAADLIVVPVPPTPLAFRSLAQIEEHLESHHDRRPQLLPVISMVDRRKNLHRDFVAAHPDWLVIPQASIVERMAVERAPLAAYAGSSLAAKAISGLWSEVERILGTPVSKAQTSARKLVRIPSSGR